MRLILFLTLLVLIYFTLTNPRFQQLVGYCKKNTLIKKGLIVFAIILGGLIGLYINLSILDYFAFNYDFLGHFRGE